MFGSGDRGKRNGNQKIDLEKRLAERETFAKTYEERQRELQTRSIQRGEGNKREELPDELLNQAEPESKAFENPAPVGKTSRKGPVAGQGSLFSNLQEKREKAINKANAEAEDQVVDRIRERMKREFGERIVKELSSQEFQEKIRESIENALKDEASVVKTPADRRRLADRIYNLIMGLGPLEKLFRNKEISEIMVSRFDKIFIEQHGKMVLSDVAFASERELRNVVEQIVAPIGRVINDSEPIVDGRLADGSRVNIVIPPIAVDGTIVTIRRFPEKKLVPEDYIYFESCDWRILQFLKWTVEGQFNTVVSGGTGSGKTSLLNLLSNFLNYDPGLSVVTIEDSCELRINHPNVRRFETRLANAEGKNEITSRMLVKASLRQRPDVIVIGEIRDGTMADFLRAATSGHDGCMTTVHNNSPEELAETVQVLFKMAEDYDFTEAAINRLYCNAVDVIVQIRRYPDHVRRISNISHVVGYGKRGARALGIKPGDPEYDKEEVYVRDIFEWRKTGIRDNGVFTGVFEPTGYIPEALIEKLELHQVNIDMNLFNKNYDWNTEKGMLR